MSYSSFLERRKDQRKALNWGIFGSFFLRGLLLVSGVSLVSVAPWLLYACGAFLLFSGMKILFSKKDDDESPEKTVNFVKKWLPTISLFALTIVTIELTDLLFALDSIPAAFGITSDLFILFTSNIFAVLGLRSLYFVMTAAIEKFHFLDKGVATILAGTGLKMLIKNFLIISTPITFAFILSILAVSIVSSSMKECALQPETPKNKGIMRSVCTFFFKPEKVKEENKNVSDSGNDIRFGI